MSASSVDLPMLGDAGQMPHEFKELLEMPSNTLGLVLGSGLVTGIVVAAFLLYLRKRHRDHERSRGNPPQRRARGAKKRRKRRPP